MSEENSENTPPSHSLDHEALASSTVILVALQLSEIFSVFILYIMFKVSLSGIENVCLSYIPEN